MKKIIAALSVQLVLAAATPALARVQYHPVPSSTVHSGRSAPSNWNDIEVSHPEGGM